MLLKRGVILRHFWSLFPSNELPSVPKKGKVEYSNNRVEHQIILNDYKRWIDELIKNNSELIKSNAELVKKITN